MTSLRRLKGITAFSVTVGIALAAGLASPVTAETVEQQLADLRARVDDIYGDGTKGFRIAPNTRLKVYGYVKTDFIADLDYDLGTTIFDIINVVPGTPTDTTFRAQAIQSRIGFWTYTDTSFGELQTRIEGDFFGGGANGGQFRLRHAYGQLGGLLIGKTWTNFMPIESYPDALDFQGPAGIPFARPEQVRYTYDVGNGFSLSGSIERDSATSGASNNPAVTAAGSYSFGDSFVKLAGLYRTVPSGGQDIDAWGVNLSGNTKLWKGGTLQASLTTGEGIGSYMVFGGDDVLGTSAIRTSGVTLGLNQAINDKVSFGLVYGYRDIDQGALPTDTENLTTVHASIYYKPVEKMQLGLEYIYAEKQQFNGINVDASRIQASAQFNF
ncbi:MAG: DcaP family trimeric outer membrane transporter [Pseudorhodobacter sp.]|nr:DcaP family trimeric outer membrane transporter [Pseudorhodobacter sp.]